MTPEDDLEYFTRRHLQHAASAARCEEPSARHAHKVLADLHRQKAGNVLAKRTERPTLKLKTSKPI